jgi:hypothetical protein
MEAEILTDENRNDPDLVQAFLKKWWDINLFDCFVENFNSFSVGAYLLNLEDEEFEDTNGDIMLCKFCIYK